MTTRIETEDVSSTKSEKFLAVILAAFILVGSGWFYWKTYDWVGEGYNGGYTTAEQKIIDRANEADEAYWEAEEVDSQARITQDQARADLNLAVDQGRDTTQLEAEFRAAQEAARTASDQRTTAQNAQREARERADQVERDVTARINAADTGMRRFAVAGIRLAMILGMLGGSLAWIQRLRERESRWMPLAFAVAGSATIMAFVFLVDYVTDYIDILELGPIVLSAIGIALTILAFMGLQKYLTRRIPRTRVRKGECPFCAFPVRVHQAHCEGCGREVIASCASCGKSRRVGSPHCGHCGVA